MCSPPEGPGTATTTLTWKTYLTTFDSLDFGLGNAYAYTISLITFALALVYFRVLYRRGEFESMMARASDHAGDGLRVTRADLPADARRGLGRAIYILAPFSLACATSFMHEQRCALGPAAMDSDRTPRFR